MTTWTRETIADFIRNDLLLQRLDLASSGITADDLTEQAALMGPPIAIDSVDAIDLLVGLERKFELPTQELTGDFIKQTCATIESLTNYVCAHLAMPQPTA